MELAPLGLQLTAKKAWFFFDDSIAFLTTSITSPSANRVETVVNQWPLMNASSQLVRENDWAALENVGYWFPTGGDLKTSRETRTGTWAALGGSTDTTPHAAPIVTMWLDHGVTPTNARAEYVIVPNVTASAMRSWAASRPLTVLANTNVASAVRDNRTGATGVVFWAAGSVEGISAPAAALVYLMGDGRELTLSAADPNANATGTLAITIPGIWTTKAVPYTVSKSGFTTITVPRAGGQTTVVKLQRVGKRRSA
jgi:hyaluronate lyase